MRKDETRKIVLFEQSELSYVKMIHYGRRLGNTERNTYGFDAKIFGISNLTRE